MKKILFLALTLTCLPAYGYFEPQWSDISPQGYQNINIDGTYFMPQKRYWQERRRNFDTSVNYCKTTFANKPENLSGCFDELRKIENNKTNIWIQYQTTKAIGGLY